MSKPKSRIRGILNFKQLMEASLHRSNGPRDQLHFGVPSTDFADRGPSTKLEFCNTYYRQSRAYGSHQGAGPPLAKHVDVVVPLHNIPRQP